MKRMFTGAILALVTIGLCACFPESDNPVGSVTTDMDLAGKWGNPPKEGQPSEGYYEMVPGSDGKFAIHFTKEGDATSGMELEGFTSEANGQKYLAVRMLSMGGQPAAMERWWLLHYKVENDTFTMRMMKLDEAATAVKAGALKGEVTGDEASGIPAVHISSSSDELAAYLADPANDKIWDVPEPLVRLP